MEELRIGSHNGYPAHSPTMRDVFAIAFRARRLIALSFFGILSGAIVTAVLQPSRYDAEMKILVKRDRVDPMVTPQVTSMPQFTAEVSEAELNSEVELLKSRELLEKTVIACDLQARDPSILSSVISAISVHSGARTSKKEDVQMAIAVRTLAKELKVDVVKRTNLIAVNYEASDPQLAAHVLNTLANLYLEKHVSVHRPPGAFDFFQQETQRYREGLTRAEARLVDFNHGAAVVSAPVEKAVALQKLAEFDGSLKQTEAAIAETQQRIHILQEQAASIPTRMVTQVRKADDSTLLSHFRSNLLTLEQKHTELLGKFESSYRPVQEVEAQIAQTRAALALAEQSQLHEETTDRDTTYEWVREELAKARADLAGLQARATATAKAVRSYQEHARLLEEKEILQDDLIRTVKVTEDNYLLYLRKEEEARISDALDRGRILNVVIAQAASVPSLPSNHRSLTVLFGVLVATVISVGMAFGSEYLDSTFRTPDEIESFLNIPVLAAMPRAGKHSAAKFIISRFPQTLQNNHSTGRWTCGV